MSNRGLTPLPKRLNGCTGGNQFKVDIVYFASHIFLDVGVSRWLFGKVLVCGCLTRVPVEVIIARGVLECMIWLVVSAG